jgi:predicted DNA-binding transcriptional regulator AlpA
MSSMTQALHCPLPFLIAALQARRDTLRIDDVRLLTGLRSRVQSVDWSAGGLLPQPIRLGVRASSAWRARDVIDFIESRQVDPLARPVKSGSAEA